MDYYTGRELKIKIPAEAAKDEHAIRKALLENCWESPWRLLPVWMHGDRLLLTRLFRALMQWRPYGVGTCPALR